MAEDFSVTLSGVDEFLAKLETAPAVLAAGNLRAMNKVAKHGEAVAKSNVPRRQGHLFSSISSHVDGSGSELAGHVGPNTDYAKFVEFGTGMFGELAAPHRIVPATKKVMSWKGSGGTVFARSTKGMKPKHYMKPAKEAVKADGPAFFRAEATAIRDHLAGGKTSTT